ncbi:MAG TPA: NAD(P)/FAD-dependent oxidoreductase [Acidimicrobiales bacterium]|nr:NAD(P)/FAD-dependent oxidoreductase [Acidimicrobiales bacterium]
MGKGAEHLDVLIVGAGISGIGGACHLRQQHPDRSFLILDALESFGGTWWTHRYPGVRSDSDLFTFGYRFKPWRKAPIASAAEILHYMGEVIEDFDLAPHIRYQHRITSATWSSDDRRWTVDVTRGDTGETLHLTTDFLYMCQGYYRHREGYKPTWEGFDTFRGEVLHPQEWPEEVDLSGKRVVVIGSGATAATLIPNIADDCAHVTMLQRSPTFFFVGANRNELADQLRDLDVPDEWTHEIVRKQIVKQHDAIAKMSFEHPEALRQFLIESIKPLLPKDFDVDKHFNPSYRPWQQRIALVPDGDLFKAIRTGKASVVTDQIERFTSDGILLASGETLEADVVITATGFDLSVMGDVAFTVDGEPVDFADTVTYRGIMFTGVPNLAYVFGYFRSSWTLRADLISDLVCRVLGHMDTHGATMVVPEVSPEVLAEGLVPWVEADNFNPGYLQRSMHLMPRQGMQDPWRLRHDYTSERDILANADLEDGSLTFK